MASGDEWVTAVELSGDEDAAGVLLRLLTSLLTHCYGWRQCETNEASLRFALRAHDDGAGGDSPLNGTVSLGAMVVFDELCVRARRRNDRSAPSHRLSLRIADFVVRTAAVEAASPRCSAGEEAARQRLARCVAVSVAPRQGSGSDDARGAGAGPGGGATTTPNAVWSVAARALAARVRSQLVVPLLCGGGVPPARGAASDADLLGGGSAPLILAEVTSYWVLTRNKDWRWWCL